MSTDGDGQLTRIQVMQWLKSASARSLAFVVKSVHEKAFNSAADIATREVKSAIDGIKDGRNFKELRNDERMALSTLQTLEADLRRQFDEALSSWPPKTGEGPSTQ